MLLDSLEKLADDELRNIAARCETLLKQRDTERKENAIAEARATLAAAGLTPPPLDRLIMHTMHEGFGPALAAMHAVPEAGDEPPLLIFRPGDE